MTPPCLYRARNLSPLRTSILQLQRTSVYSCAHDHSYHTSFSTRLLSPSLRGGSARFTPLPLLPRSATRSAAITAARAVQVLVHPLRQAPLSPGRWCRGPHCHNPCYAIAATSSLTSAPLLVPPSRAALLFLSQQAPRIMRRARSATRSAAPQPAKNSSRVGNFQIVTQTDRWAWIGCSDR